MQFYRTRYNSKDKSIAKGKASVPPVDNWRVSHEKWFNILKGLEDEIASPDPSSNQGN